MYIGSVRFFKHLILSVIALLIIVPTAGFIYFALQYQYLKAQNLTPAAAELSQISHDTSHTVYASEESADSPDAEASLAAEIPDVPLDYQLEYPQLYVENDFQYITETEKTVYLTFDDGPTKLTPQILDILEKYGVHATFFVVYQSSDEAKALYKRIVDEGHTLAIHTASHDYKKIYKSVESYLDDFAILSDMLEDVTGVKPEIFRFPGGSINNYNKEIQQELAAEMLRRGYTYYDWDVSSGSSTNTATRDTIYSHVINGVSGKQRAIVLMHDAGTSATVAALPDIIDALKASGYKFEALNKNVKPACFDYSN